QELAQAWLMATLTGSSALAVGWISILASLPQLLMPLGGVIADQVDDSVTKFSQIQTELQGV
ncbi:MAG: hypothetical protein ACK2UU_23480, partial [Anaerolineae bacterium]